MKPGTVILLQADPHFRRHKSKLLTFITLTTKGEVICLEERMSVYNFIVTILEADVFPLSLVLDLNLKIDQLEWLSKTSFLDRSNFLKLIKKLLKHPKCDLSESTIKEVFGRASNDDICNIFSDIEIAVPICRDYLHCLSTSKYDTVVGFFRLKVAAEYPQYKEPLKLVLSAG